VFALFRLKLSTQSKGDAHVVYFGLLDHDRHPILYVSTEQHIPEAKAFSIYGELVAWISGGLVSIIKVANEETSKGRAIEHRGCNFENSQELSL
jgi:hypothetical protein